MNEPGKQSNATGRKRLLFCLSLLVLLVACTVLAVAFYFRNRATTHLEAVFAQIDRLDPHWRWEEIETHRPMVPDSENAALRVAAAYKLLPKDWPSQARASEDDEPRSILDAIRDMEPEWQLDEVQTTELRAELDRAEAALKEARALVSMRAGRYPAVPVEQALGADQWMYPRRIVLLLWMEATRLAQEQKPDAALTRAQCALNVAASNGNERLMISLVVRIACCRQALTTIERTLAQGEASETSLLATQRVLQEEESQPSLLHALRGERAWGHQNYEWMEAGDLQHLSFGPVPSSDSVIGRLQLQFMGGWLKENHAVYLELMTEAVELARLPREKQLDEFRTLELKAGAMQGRWTDFAKLSIPAVTKVAEASHRSLADLRCAIASLAVERYRLAHRRWPETLQALVPTFLPEVPVDPYDRKPLRYKQLPDGVLIYSIGPDRSDNGGNVDRRNYAAAGTDLGMKVWNVDKRRQVPPELLPEPMPDVDP